MEKYYLLGTLAKRYGKNWNVMANISRQLLAPKPTGYIGDSHKQLWAEIDLAAWDAYMEKVDKKIDDYIFLGVYNADMVARKAGISKQLLHYYLRKKPDCPQRTVISARRKGWTPEQLPFILDWIKNHQAKMLAKKEKYKSQGENNDT